LEELSLEEVRKISASMGRLLWLAFSGGEIFLRDDIVEITKIFYEQNKPAIILLPTNGQLPEIIRERTEQILKHCRKSTVVVKLSLDGPEEIHDTMRGVKGAFRKTLETYRLLGLYLDEYDNFELGVNSVFCGANQDRMEEIIGYVGGLDRIKTHTVSLVRGDIPKGRLKEIAPGKYCEMSGILEQNLKNKLTGGYRFRGSRIKTAQDILQRRLIYETLTRQKRSTPCFAGKLTTVITESGDVYPCESFAGKIGNVRESDYDVNRILRSKEGKKVRRDIGEKKCHCTHECYFMINILFNPARYPSLLREYAQL
jgi:radical SAM protein with 4Fe4S-binding SPASM domain